MNTTYFLNLTAGNVFGSKTTPPLPSKYYLGISSTAPNVDGTNATEPTASEYARIEITSLTEPVNGVVTNALELSFEKVVSAGGWGVFPYYVIYDALINGNLLIYKEMTYPATLNINNMLKIEQNGLELATANHTVI